MKGKALVSLLIHSPGDTGFPSPVLQKTSSTLQTLPAGAEREEQTGP